MKKTLLLISALFCSNLFADEVGFVCRYYEDGVKLFHIDGSLDEDGGKLGLRGSFITGKDKTIRKRFWRVQRKNEDAYSYAKFDIKKPNKRKKWLQTYYRFSLPKTVLDGTTEKFSAYFGHFYAEEPDENIMVELPRMRCRVKESKSQPKAGA